jgi:methyl-accepting chemotaxis protein
MNQQAHKEQRRRVMVDAGFQVKYTLLLVGVAVAVFVVLAVLYREVLREEKALLGLQSASVASQETIGADDREFNDDLRGRVEMDDQRRILALAVAAAVLVGVLAWIGIHMTFRAAGPALAVSRMLRAMASGDFTTLRRLRDKDHFRFLEEDLFALRDALRREAEEEVAALNSAEESLGGGKGGERPESARQVISTMRERKERRFGL